MEEPTVEQIKELWEWCGFKIFKNKDKDSVFYGFPLYIYPNSQTPIINTPELDLNNLFKYAVPRTIAALIVENGIDEYEALRIIFARWLEKFKEGYSFNDALFWAIYKEAIK